jgi:hypothetical protein
MTLPEKLEVLLKVGDRFYSGVLVLYPEPASEKPTERQVKFAQDLAKQRGIQAPDFSKMTKNEVSKWIEDVLRSKRG